VEFHSDTLNEHAKMYAHIVEDWFLIHSGTVVPIIFDPPNGVHVSRGSTALVPTQPPGYWGLFPWSYRGRGVKLTTHFHLVPRPNNASSSTSTPQYVFMA
jgi:hypothetical protein